MDTNSVMRRGRNERGYRCAGPCAGPALGRRNVGTVDENFALGKNPCAHRPGFVRFHVLGAPIAQLDRASDYGSEGYRFNSYWVRHLPMKTTARLSVVAAVLCALSSAAQDGD